MTGDQVDELHAQVGLAALGANTSLLHVYDGKVADPTPDPPYVLVYTRVAWPRDGIGTALDTQQRTVTCTYTCHCVGLTADAARVVAMQVRATLLNLKPSITGRSCSPIKQDESLDPRRDETTGRLVMSVVSIYSFTSTG